MLFQINLIPYIIGNYFTRFQDAWSTKANRWLLIKSQIGFYEFII